MQKLAEGYCRFRQKVLPRKKELFRQLARGQHPEALFITCADSRVVPDLITQSSPGDLFICRNAGNIVPPHGERIGGVSATIEYAVLGLGIQNIIVCGHSDCGAMRAVLNPWKLHDMPVVEQWLRYADTPRRIVRENYKEAADEERLEALIHENVLAQLDHLRTHPSVAAGLARAALNLYAWVYQIETGEVSAYDASRDAFLPLSDNQIPDATPRPRRIKAAS